ncbi:NADH-quinone oxidoreductase subunit L [Marinilongibacter aquaticus]|uniref:NADH-quinone oxidoreductase subunit 5 family protein n=1 Tax=Marinilongibacter aquaticus TaxID=2975157 RepID=UPI0021BD8568|nr:NADH-quinone oxidoreductase subunit L [Marinilongibacter aquaticus]UBM58134.1 NADH-quinone oxidoreductase subunit L [Marinilongibacter aquaticus]
MLQSELLFITLGLYLLGFGSLALGRNRLKPVFVYGISLFINGVGFALALQALRNDTQIQQIAFDWIHLHSHTFSFDLLLNELSLFMWPLVQGIALLVQIFSIRYLRNEARIALYFAYLNLFVFSMLGLVISGNLMPMFMFWELVGFCSYLLIGFWYNKPSAARASLKAFLMNRVGDAGFLIGLGLVYAHFDTLNLPQIVEKLSTSSVDTTWMTLCLFAGCMGKSAQFPLQTWLPDAMEGPTPASALIHAATMVAAGIFLLARVDFLITPAAGTCISAIGALTALLAAYSAIFQSDIKKVLAFSTVSQLGLMVMAMGAGETNIALFHLFTHAFFKAGLFLIAGAAIDYFHHEQDMNKMGGLLKEKPIWALAYLICGGALAGLPLSSGYLSKDALILGTFNWAFAQQSGFYLLIPFVGFLASLMTAFYVCRQFVLVFLGESTHSNPSREKWRFTAFELGIIPLSLASLGILHSQNPFAFENAFFGQWLPFSEQHNHWIAYSLLVLVLATLAFSYWLFEVKKFVFAPNFWTQIGLKHFYFDQLYLQKFVPFLIGKDEAELHTENESLHPKKKLRIAVDENGGLAGLLAKFDRKVVDGFVSLVVEINLFLARLSRTLDQHLIDSLVTKISDIVNGSGRRLKRIQNGRVQSYLITLVLTIIALSLILSLR